MTAINSHCWNRDSTLRPFLIPCHALFMPSHSFTQHLTPFVTNIDTRVANCQQRDFNTTRSPKKEAKCLLLKSHNFISGTALAMKRRTRWPSQISRQKNMDVGKLFRWIHQFVEKRETCFRHSHNVHLSL